MKSSCYYIIVLGFNINAEENLLTYFHGLYVEISLVVKTFLTDTSDFNMISFKAEEYNNSYIKSLFFSECKKSGHVLKNCPKKKNFII